MLKRLFLMACLSCGALAHGGTGDSQVLLAPIDAARVGAFDWGVVILSDPIPDKGTTADRGSLKINLDLAKFFAEGYAIYSITKLDVENKPSPSLLLVLVRPKAK